MVTVVALLAMALFKAYENSSNIPTEENKQQEQTTSVNNIKPASEKHVKHIQRPANSPDADILSDRGGAESALRALASQMKKRQSCSKRFRGPLRQRQRFPNGTSLSEIVNQLIEEYCPLTTSMEAQNISAPLYVETGVTNLKFAESAASSGCRVKLLTHFEPLYSTQTLSHMHSNISMRFGFPHSGGANIKTSIEYPQLSVPMTESKEMFASGKFKYSNADYQTVAVPGVNLSEMMNEETLIPILIINGGGLELSILQQSMSLIDNHRVQCLVFNLWPSLMLHHTHGALRAKFEMLINHLHHRGYHLYYSSVMSVNALVVPQLPNTPECPAQLVDFLDFSTAFDSVGLSTNVVAVKT